MDPIQTMPNGEFLTKEAVTARQWLTYYQNIWTRNLVARVIDVHNDIALKAKNPDEEVTLVDGRPGAVKTRLEQRKIAVQDAVDLLASVEKLLALSDEELPNVWGIEALKVDADMVEEVKEETTPAPAEVEEAPAPVEPEVAPAEPASETQPEPGAQA